MKWKVEKDSLLLEHLYEHLDMPKKRVKQYLTHGSVYVNNNKVTQYNYPLQKGMTIVMDTNQKTKKTLPFDIVFEDEEYIAVNKPSGLLTIATNKEKEKTLYHIVGEYLKEKNRNAKVFIVHRLDKDTSGIVLFAKNEKSKNKLQENWSEYVSLREYVAVVYGTFSKKKDTIVEYLKETKTALVYSTKNKEGKEAITHYEVIKENDQYSLLKIMIDTGRKHQIRVGLSDIHHPILGDKKYGFKEDKNTRLYLHANRLKFYHPGIKKEILLETSNPKEFQKVMKEGSDEKNHH